MPFHRHYKTKDVPKEKRDFDVLFIKDLKGIHLRGDYTLGRNRKQSLQPSVNKRDTICFNDEKPAKASGYKQSNGYMRNYGRKCPDSIIHETSLKTYEKHEKKSET